MPHFTHCSSPKRFMSEVKITVRISKYVFFCPSSKNKIRFICQFSGLICLFQILINYTAMQIIHYRNDPCLMKEVLYFYIPEYWKLICIVEAASISPISILGPFSGKSTSLREKIDNKTMHLLRAIFIPFISMSFMNVSQCH